MAELTGQTFAGYEIVAKLGEGGMGAVYKAKQPILNRFVALKTMAAHLGGDKEFVARFQREAASAATLSHPNVVGVHTAGEVDGTHYIVMEFVEGESVRKRLDREGRIPPAEALAITIYVAQALQHAWNEAKLIHRDIKPDNIFISKKGEVKVGDLGLAKSLATEGTEMTATGMAMGSPHYISPEQATGIKDIDFRTDIYSLGCTLYHMLTGQTPYKGDSAMIVMMKHVNDPPPAIFKAWPQCPMPLGMLVGRMLAKDRNTRPKSYEQLIADLFAMSEKLKQTAAAPAPPPAPVPTSKPTVVEKAAAPALAPATSPDAPTVALQSSTKPKSFVAIYAAGGVAALLALGGLFLWSPWGKPSTQDSNTPSLQQSSSSESPWMDGLAEWWVNPKNATSGVLVKEAGGSRKLAPTDSVWFAKGRDIAIRATVTGQKWSSWFVGLRNGLKGNYSAHLTSPGRSSSLTVTVDGKSKELQEFSIPPGFRIEQSHVMEFRVQGDLLTVALDGTEVARVRDSSLPDAGNVFLAGPSGTLIEKFEYRDLSAAPRSVDDAFVREVAALPAEQQLARVLEKLQELNPKFTRNNPKAIRHKIVGGQVEELHFGSGNITDISPIRALAKLKKLSCGGNSDRISPLNDFSALRGLQLENLNLTYSRVSDLSPLDGMPLKQFSCDPAAAAQPANKAILRSINTLETINGMPAADFWKQVTASKVPDSVEAPATDDAFLREVAALPAEQQVKRVMEKLVELNPKFNKAEARERHEIENGAVTLLVFSACNITDISPVRALTNLRKLGCGGMAGKYSPLADLSPLRGLKLTKLIVYGTRVRDLSPLKDMPLTALELGHTAIEDLSPLQGLALTELQVQQTRVRDLTPLRGMPLEDFRCYHNKDISDLSPLQSAPLKVLVCFNTSARDLSLLKGAPLTDLRCDPAAAATPSTRQILTAIKTLKKINDLPAAEFWKQVDAGKLPKARLALADPIEEAGGASDDAGWQNAINLLPLIDPQEDAVAGTWTTDNGELKVSQAGSARLQIPYQPPEEYDFRIVFTRQTSDNVIWQILTGKGHGFCWCVAADRGRSLGFERIGGLGLARNPTCVTMQQNLENGRRYTSLVQVRRDGVKGFLDGRFISEWKTDYRDMSLPDWLALRDQQSLGIGSGANATVFHAIEVREVTGKGTFTRGAPSGASAWLPLDIAVACNADIINTAERQSSDQFTYNGGRWASASWLRKNGFSEPGIPDDGRVPIPGTTPPGSFQVQMPPAKNTLLMSSPDGPYSCPVTVELGANERRAYSELALLHAGCWGNGTLRVTLRYQTGSAQTVSLPIIDWGLKARTAPLPPEVRVALITRDAHPKFGAPAEMFSQKIPADPQRALQSLTFELELLTPPLKVSEKDARKRFILGICGISALLAASSADSAVRTPESAIAPDAALKQLGNVYRNSVGAEMVYIPPGEFMLGSTKEERDWAVMPGNMGSRSSALKRVSLEGERPPRRAVVRSGFWMGRTEVTVGQWRKFVDATGHPTTAEIKGVAMAHGGGGPGLGQIRDASWRKLGFSSPIQDNHPVVCVSWDDATAFCKWLNMHEQAAGRLPSGCVMRLPTEAEWEYACRGGKQGARFWWGDAKEDGKERLNWSRTSDADDALTVVDQFGERGRNGFGLADMAGNVWEWCLDNLDSAGAHAELYTDTSSMRVLKGGAFDCMPLATRCASREGRPADTADFRYGFRICLGPDMPGSTSASDTPALQHSTAPAPDAGWQKAINLLPLIDPQKDAVTGEWTVENGALVGDKETSAHIEIPYQPPDEYDYRIEFTPLNPTPSACQVLVKNERAFAWSCFGHKGNLFGFSMVNGRVLSNVNRDAKVVLSPAELGHRYVSRVEVRNDGLRGYLDGNLLVTWKTDYKDMSLGPDWQLRTPKVLGLGCKSRIIFHRIEVREVTGKGTLLRKPSN